MNEEKKLKIDKDHLFYKKGNNDKNNTWFYIRIAIYAVCLILIIATIFRIKIFKKTIPEIEKIKTLKVKAEIYGNKSIYNNYYYGVRINRPSADWDIYKVQDVYETPVIINTFEDRLKPIVKFTTKNREEELANVVISAVIINEPRSSESLAQESFESLQEKFGTDNINVIQKPTPHSKGSLKASYYVVEITHPEKISTFIDVFIVKNRRAFNIHGETDPIRYDTYIWDFEHYINNFVIYKLQNP